MIDLLIFELLRRKGRVVVPNLGAFFIKEEQISNEKESGSFTVLFSDSLRFNDGILISHLKRIEGLSIEEAELQVEKYVDELQVKLKAGNRHIISNLGYLQIEKDELVFYQTHQPTLDQGLSINEPSDAFKQAANTNPQPTTHNPEPGTRNPEPGTRNPEPGTRNPEPGTHNPEPETQNPEPGTHNSQPETRNPQPGTRNPEPATHNPEPATRNPEPATHNPEPETHNPEPRTRNPQPTNPNPQPATRNSQPTLTILLLIAVLVVVTLGVAWWFDLLPMGEKEILFEPEPVEAIATDATQNQWFDEKEPAQPAESGLSQADTLISATIENAEPEVFDTIAFMRENSFHIVAASCNTHDLAKETLEDLHAKGYDQCIIMNQTDGKFRVTYASFSNRAEAIVALEKIRNKENHPDAWLLIYKP